MPFPTFNSIAKATKVAFGYDAVTDKKRRRRPASIIRPEDDELALYDRKKLVATTKDITRNFSVAAWMIRKHLDYVSRFNFRAKGPDVAVNREIERFLMEASKRRNFDAGGRHDRNRSMRLFEAGKVIDGDAALYKLGNGKTMGIEGNRITKPSMGAGVPDKAKGCTDHGLVIDRWGGVQYYVVCKRSKHGQLEFDRVVSSDLMIFDGYFTRFDQYRGVSPLASALNNLRDLDETWEYMRIKLKMHAMFGIAIESDEIAEDDGFPLADRDTDSTPTSSTTKYDFEMEPGLKILMERGDKIHMVESKNPSAEFNNYQNMMIAAGLAAVDIPYTYWDQSKTNYSQMKAARAEYEESCKPKRESNQNALDEWARWRIGVAQDADTDQPLSLASFPLLERVDRNSYPIEVQPIGQPWINEYEEANAASLRIATGLSSRQRECKRRGEDFYETLQELAQEEKAITDAGVTIAIGQPGQITTRDEEGADNDANVKAKEVEDGN